MSEQKPEQSSGEAGSPSAGPAISSSSDVQSEPVAASASELGSTDSHLIAPDHEAPKADVPRAEAPKADAPKVEAAEPAAPRMGGKLMIMSPGNRSFGGNEADAKTESERAPGMFGKRRAAALAAVVVLAAVAGAIGGAMATVGYAHLVGGDAANAGNGAIEASVARIDADILALKASVEHTSKTGIAQFNKANDRLDKVERAQAEPAAKLAKLSEAVDKLRAAPPAAPVPVAAVTPKEVTGSIAPAAATPAAASKVEVARLPAVEGWVLRDVGYGGALIESRRGTYEVYAGDMIPGLGRIDAIRRQDGHWVVVTSKGLVVAR